MRRAIRFLALAIVVIAVAWWLIHLPGSVSARIGQTVVTAPTSVALVSAVVLFLVLYAVIRLVATLVRIPARSAQMRLMRRRRRGEAAMTRTLVALASGDGSAAMREIERSRNLLGDTPQTLLFAAYAGRQAGRVEDAQSAFQALADRSDTAFLGLRGLMQQAIAEGDLTRAAALAAQAEAASPGAAWLRTERSNLAIRMGDWKQALALSLAGPSQAPLAAAAAAAETNPAEAVRLARRAHDADPAFVPAALAYAVALRATGRESKAQDVLRAAWVRTPHPDLAAAALASDSDAAARLKRSRTLAQAAPGSAEGALLMARALHESGQPEAALQQVAAAQAAGLNERRLWVIASDVAMAAGNDDAQIKALHRRANAAPDTVWRCAQCNAEYAAWQPVCDACGTPGRIDWGRSPGEAGGQALLADEVRDAILP